eukprot:GAHX01003950.1.p1 GENE.GAHX01003950.1~~GAHX01003950.1.p1  ORF type:complete len:521 (-),score=106.23 GAHX01003950.1:29-1591(-)
MGKKLNSMFQACESCFSTELSQQSDNGVICLNCGYSTVSTVENFDKSSPDFYKTSQSKKLSKSFSNHLLSSSSTLDTQKSHQPIEDVPVFPEIYHCTFKLNRLILDAYQHIFNLFIDWFSETCSFNKYLLKKFTKEVWFLFLDKWAENGWSENYNNVVKITHGTKRVIFGQNKNAISLYFGIKSITRPFTGKHINSYDNIPLYNNNAISNLHISTINTSILLTIALKLSDFFGISSSAKKRTSQFLANKNSEFPLFNFKEIITKFFEDDFEKAMIIKRKSRLLNFDEIKPNDCTETNKTLEEKEKRIYNTVRDNIIKFNIIPKPSKCGLAMYIQRKSCKFENSIICNIKNKYKEEIFTRINLFNLFKKLKFKPLFITSFFRFYTSLKNKFSDQKKHNIYAWFCSFLLYYLNCDKSTWFSKYKIVGSIVEGAVRGPVDLLRYMKRIIKMEEVKEVYRKNILNIYYQKCKRIKASLNRKQQEEERFELLYGNLKEVFNMFEYINIYKIDKDTLKRIFLSLNK